MAGKYKPKKTQRSYQADWKQESDLDYTAPYPCGVCGKSFTSRYSLAHHPHRRSA